MYFEILLNGKKQKSYELLTADTFVSDALLRLLKMIFWHRLKLSDILRKAVLTLY